MKKYKISDNERDIICKFQKLCIPEIFKDSDEYMNYFLFIEEVDFTVCNLLLRGKTIDQQVYDNILYGEKYYHCGFEHFIETINPSKLDFDSRSYYNMIVKIISIFKKYKSDAN